MDLAAFGVDYKEGMNLPLIPAEVEQRLPEEMREYFRESLQFYRQEALKFPRGTDPIYQKEEQK